MAGKENPMASPGQTDWLNLVDRIGPRFAAKAAQHDDGDMFVTENFSELKTQGVFACGIPVELGGGGASHSLLCEMLRKLGRYCGSTALALSMHTHLVASMVWRWRREPAAVEGLLRRIVDEQLFLVSTGASDWLKVSARAERTAGGWQISGKKRFCSGVPAGDWLLTGAVCEVDGGPATVLHFPLPVTTHGVRVLDTWRVLGMRATGSHDVLLENVFVPDSSILAHRPQGIWHPVLHVSVMLGLPIIFSVYIGIAEAARDLAIKAVRNRPSNQTLLMLIGEMENDLALAQIAHADMVATAATAQPGPETTNRVMTGRTLVGRSAIRVVEKAMEAAGGIGFYRATGLERSFRDVQAARYHSPNEKAQQLVAGRLALGLNIDC